MTKWGLFNWIKFNFCVSWQDINKLEAFSNSAIFGKEALLKRGIKCSSLCIWCWREEFYLRAVQYFVKFLAEVCKRSGEDTSPLCIDQHWIFWGKWPCYREVKMPRNFSEWRNVPGWSKSGDCLFPGCIAGKSHLSQGFPQAGPVTLSVTQSHLCRRNLRSYGTYRSIDLPKLRWKPLTPTLSIFFSTGTA